MTRNKYITISLYIIIPAIFTGMSVLAIILTYQITSYYLQQGIRPDAQIIVFTLAIGMFTFFCSLFIMRIILKPIFKFVKNAKNLPIISHTQEQNSTTKNVEDIEHLQGVLTQVTTILGKMEATTLFPEIIGESRDMRGIFGQIIKVAPSNSTVLITGESGTGKELIAAGIHQHSLRHEKPFIKVNCVAIPEGLLESEFFGHEKGAFTGATTQKKGRFELADEGTIFLDEIGDMPLTTQAKILRVLQEMEFERVGGVRPIRIDVRVIAATNKNLQEMVKAGTFREDLYYRLNVFCLHLPPLRERREDIPFLCEHFLEQQEKEIDVSPKAMQILLQYHWPGNIRELQNVVERAAVMSEGTIEPQHLPSSIASDIMLSLHGEKENVVCDNQSIDDRLNEIEKAILIEAISRAGGVQAKAAQLLGINQRSMWHRIKKYQIDVTSLRKSTVSNKR